MFNHKYKYAGYFVFACSTKGTKLIEGWATDIDKVYKLAQRFHKKYPKAIVRFAKI